MKYVKRVLSLCLCCVLVAGMFAGFVSADETEKSVDIMFVHDTHSHLNPFATVEDGKTQVLGGFAKLKTLINEQKKKNPDTLLLDAGDFSMGTLIQAVYEEEASEIRMLGQLGIDVSTLGNHEFDYKASGIANMMNNAVASKDPIPAMVLCNIDWEGMAAKGLTEDQTMLKAAFENIGMKDYVMVEKNGVKIAVLGMIGIDSIACIPNPPLDFKDPVEAVKTTVANIKTNEDADMIVCISHGGTWEDEEKSEDEILAKAVPELDVIISGHTHTKLDEAIVHGSTYIVSVGEYGKYLGSLNLTQNSDGRWTLNHYEPITVGENIVPDPATQEKVNALMDMVDSKYLEQFGLTKDEILCENDVEFCPQGDLGTKHTELNLGSIIADSYTYAAEQLLGKDTVAVSVAPAGTIRDSYPLGNITTEIVFNSFSLGIGEDGIPGYPLIGVYLTGAELKTAAEIDSTVSDLMTTARLYTDGLYWHYNPNRMLLNKATDVFLVNNDEQREELVDDQLYLVVTDFYSSQMLGNVTKMSYGLLSIVPKFADGTPIERYEDAVLKDAHGNELKAWTAIANYMKSMEDTDGNGIPNMDEKYAKEEGRKVVEDSKNIIDLVKNPNKFFFIIIGLILVIIAVFVGIVLLILKLIKKGKKKRK